MEVATKIDFQKPKCTETVDFSSFSSYSKA